MAANAGPPPLEMSVLLDGVHIAQSNREVFSMTHSDPWIVGLLFTIAINVAEMNLRAQKAPWP
jgi:hypothetical protein